TPKPVSLEEKARAPNGVSCLYTEVRLETGHGDFAVLDRKQVEGRLVLGAFLAGRSFLDQVDVAVHSLHLDVPQGGADGFRLGFAGCLDGRRGDENAVVAAEAFGQAADGVI